ncbi:MAG: sugar ABC transporter permease [Spirochaetales bacterium]|nr:sugar ABC transporter permease [Spirochaetales bacterium]
MVFAILIAPAVVMVTVFIILPVVQAVFYSFFNWNGLGGPPSKIASFEGNEDFLGNFKTALSDNLFWNALKNNIIVIVFSVLVQLPVAFLLAITVSRKKTKLMIFFRAVCFLPYILSEIITGTIWTYVYHPRHGFIKAVMQLIAPQVEYAGLLAVPETVFIGILIVIFWKYFGLHMIIYIAGFQAIPPEYFEAARIDGANGRQILWHITIPQMKPAIQMSLFFCIIGSLQLFDVVWAMGQGDPVHAGETLVVYLFKFGIRVSQMGFGSAVAILIFLLCLTFNVFYQRIVRD